MQPRVAAAATTEWHAHMRQGIDTAGRRQGSCGRPPISCGRGGRWCAGLQSATSSCRPFRLVSRPASAPSASRCCLRLRESVPFLGAAAPAPLRVVAAAALGSAPQSAASGQMSREQVQLHLKNAANIIATSHLLISSDPAGFNAALLVWDIERLWRLSAQRYQAGASEALTTVGPAYNMLDEFPDTPGQVFIYEGRAAMPAGLRLKFFDRFRKVFFSGQDADQLYGRVELGKGPLLDALYPLYFRVNLQPCTVPATNEITDVQLEYLAPESMGLTREEIPGWAWPSPGAQRWPFSGGLTDHMRAVGPGCWAGVGWKDPRPGLDVGRRFFTFMLIRRHD